MMPNTTDFAQNISSYFTDFLPLQRNYSKNTIQGYRDAIKLFLRFVSDEKGIDINKFSMNQFNREIVAEFLNYMRKNGQKVSTVNQRLAALKSFANYCQIESLENISALQNLQSIKPVKGEIKQIVWLSEEQTNELINKPDTDTDFGLKHRAILCMLYDTGARVQEICDLRIMDITLGKHPTVRLTGKGNKIRIVPISKGLNDLMTIYLDHFCRDSIKTDNVFKNKNGLKLSRDGISYIIQKYTNIVRLKDSNFPEKIHPHCFRHSKAMHMVSAGIPLIYIRDFLGHEDISTTMIYAKADPRMKEKAINELAPKIIEEAENTADWTKDKSLMSFLNNL